MNQGIKRSILRWIHIVLSIPILGYIYSPFEEIPNYAPAVRYVFLPILVLSGLWMWKGHVLIPLISHARWDHNAASDAIKKLTGAKHMVMEADVSVVESGGKADFQYGAVPTTLYAPTKVDRALHDGESEREPSVSKSI